MKKNNKKGFTIVELVIVIAVIAILSAVLIPTFSNITKKAKESAAIQAATSAVTEYLAEDSANIETKQELLIDTGDKLVYVATDNSKTVTDDAAKGTNKTAATVVTTPEVANIATYYELVENHYVKTADTELDNAKKYYTVNEIDGYTFYGTFEGCNVYVK